MVGYIEEVVLDLSFGNIIIFSIMEEVLGDFVVVYWEILSWFFSVVMRVVFRDCVVIFTGYSEGVVLIICVERLYEVLGVL